MKKHCVISPVSYFFSNFSNAEVNCLPIFPKIPETAQVPKRIPRKKN